MLDLKNQKFGKLVAIEPTEIRKRSWYWKCKCDCGNTCEAQGTKLKLGLKKSCGCLLKREGRWNWSGYEEITGFNWRRVLNGAISRNLEVKITIKDAWSIFLKQNRRCALSNEILTFSSKNQSYDGTASLDRIDSSKGYTINNIQWIHKNINQMKMDMSDNDLIYWARKISNATKDRIVSLPIYKQNKTRYV